MAKQFMKTIIKYGNMQPELWPDMNKDYQLIKKNKKILSLFRIPKVKFTQIRTKIFSSLKHGLAWY